MLKLVQKKLIYKIIMSEDKALKKVQENGYELENLSDEFKKNKKIVIAAVTNNGHALQYADDSLKKDKKFILEVVKIAGYSIKYADKKLKADKEVALAAIKQDVEALKYADKKFKSNKEIVLIAVKQNGDALQYADKKLQADKEVVLTAIKENREALKYADKKLKGNKEIVLTAVKQCGDAIQYADKKLKADKEVVLTAIKQDIYGNILQYADGKLKADKEVVLTAVKQNGVDLQYASTSLKKDKEVVSVAIKQDGNALQYAHASLKKDKDIFKTGEEVYKNFIKSENLKGEELTKISVSLHKISERESVSGTYFFEDGTSKEGVAYNNNKLSGNIYFSNNDGTVPLKEFVQRLNDNEWTQYISEFIDNFEGPGKSIDYDEDEFERFEEGESIDCDYDAKQDPSTISFYFGAKEVVFEGRGDSYASNKTTYIKENIIELVNSLISDE